MNIAFIIEEMLFFKKYFTIYLFIYLFILFVSSYFSYVAW